MRKNTLKEKMAAGKAVFGVQLNFPSTAVAELLGHIGFDWVLIDNEHGSVTVDNVEPVIMASELVGMAPIIRPIGRGPEHIAPFLDRGAWGVQVPRVNTAEEARVAVDASKYYPLGHRGMFTMARPAEYGIGSSPGEYVEAANRETLVCVMIEEVEGVNNLKEIVKVDGIDVFYVGPGDLSQSMGHPGEQAHADVQRAIEGAIKVIRDAGKIAGVGAPHDLISKYMDMGVQYFHGTVETLMVSSGSAYLKDMHEMASKSGLR